MDQKVTHKIFRIIFYYRQFYNSGFFWSPSENWPSVIMCKENFSISLLLVCKLTGSLTHLQSDPVRSIK